VVNRHAVYPRGGWALSRSRACPAAIVSALGARLSLLAYAIPAKIAGIASIDWPAGAACFRRAGDFQEGRVPLRGVNPEARMP
jgi:hypothetical protein